MTPDQLRRAMELTSIFENAATTLQYGYCENIKDGRGFTFGYCGFTTADDDGLAVVKQYVALQPDNNTLAQYIPAMTLLSKHGSSSTSTLPGFCDAIAALGNDSDFRAAQDAIQKSWYLDPAMKWAEGAGLQLGISKGEIYDAMINHGEGADDPFSIDYIFKGANNTMGGTPATGVDEVAWLNAFMNVRTAMLVKEGGQSEAKRVTYYRALLNAGDLNLDGPIYIEKTQGPDGWTIADVYYGTFEIASKSPGTQEVVIN